MKYFIYGNVRLEQVRRYVYERWIEKNEIFYTLPDYGIIIDEKMYTLQTVYAGAVADDEEALPFALCRIEAELALQSEGVYFKNTIDKVEYFGNYTSLRSRYYELIEEIENNFA